MSRSERLLALLDSLRQRRRPVSAAVLATETGMSPRSIYRDIATLRAQGAPIEGEAGVGYVLAPGYHVPPLMFTEDEVEALVLGARWVAGRGDAGLARAATAALAKIGAVLPADRRALVEAVTLIAGPGAPPLSGGPDPSDIRAAIRDEQRLTLRYTDDAGARSERVIWPFALAFFDQVRVVLAWCELRGDIRAFRLDRMVLVGPPGARYPRRRAALMSAWRTREGLPADLG